jgi:hypothetical protein
MRLYFDYSIWVGVNLQKDCVQQTFTINNHKKTGFFENVDGLGGLFVAIMTRFDGLGYICFLQGINLNMDDK